MTILLHVIQFVFVLMGFSLFYGFTYSRHIGLLLASIAYGGSAILSFNTMEWWPLFVGFLILGILRLFGFDPRGV